MYKNYLGQIVFISNIPFCSYHLISEKKINGKNKFSLTFHSRKQSAGLREHYTEYA